MAYLHLYSQYNPSNTPGIQQTRWHAYYVPEKELRLVNPHALLLSIKHKLQTMIIITILGTPWRDFTDSNSATFIVQTNVIFPQGKNKTPSTKSSTNFPTLFFCLTQNLSCLPPSYTQLTCLHPTLYTTCVVFSCLTYGSSFHLKYNI